MRLVFFYCNCRLCIFVFVCIFQVRFCRFAVGNIWIFGVFWMVGKRPVSGFLRYFAFKIPFVGQAGVSAFGWHWNLAHIIMLIQLIQECADFLLCLFKVNFIVFVLIINLFQPNYLLIHDFSFRNKHIQVIRLIAIVDFFLYHFNIFVPVLLEFWQLFHISIQAFFLKSYHFQHHHYIYHNFLQLLKLHSRFLLSWLYVWFIF